MRRWFAALAAPRPAHRRRSSTDRSRPSPSTAPQRRGVRPGAPTERSGLPPRSADVGAAADRCVWRGSTACRCASSACSGGRSATARQNSRRRCSATWPICKSLARATGRHLPRRHRRPRDDARPLRGRRSRRRSPPLHRDLPEAARPAVSPLTRPGRPERDRRAMIFHSLASSSSSSSWSRLLAAAAPRAEPAAARRQLRVLRLGAPVVRPAHARVHHRGLLGGAADGGRSGAQEALPLRAASP